MTDRPFNFGLERVRELRVHAEDQAKEAFAASLSARVRGEAMLAAADTRLRDALDPGHHAAPLSGSALLTRQAWVDRLTRSRADAEIHLKSCDADLASRRVSLTDASRSREVLERLKERKRTEHVADAARREAVALDEMAINGHVRRNGGAA